MFTFMLFHVLLASHLELTVLKLLRNLNLIFFLSLLGLHRRNLLHNLWTIRRLLLQLLECFAYELSCATFLYLILFRLEFNYNSLSWFKWSSQILRALLFITKVWFIPTSVFTFSDNSYLLKVLVSFFVMSLIRVAV